MDTDDAIPLPKPVAGELRIHKVYASPDRWREIARRAKLAGMSVSAYLNALIDRDEIDSAGRPVWAAPVDAQQQLPLAS
ncbi:MAG: hypothetical protein V7603_5032 [Micromonosporaceae bacterium]